VFLKNKSTSKILSKNNLNKINKIEIHLNIIVTNLNKKIKIINNNKCKINNIKNKINKNKEINKKLTINKKLLKIKINKIQIYNINKITHFKMDQRIQVNF